MGTKAVNWSHFHYRIFSLCLYGALTAVVFVAIDSFYYGYLTLVEITNFEISIGSNFVVTPLNFIL